jgi:NAD(P)-dependent dehydrogenase (short-subunit alcohol dehydrogenase family)
LFVTGFTLARGWSDGSAVTVDLLINNAGIMFLGITEAFSVDQAHEQMDANYYSVIRTMQAVLPAMRKAGSGLIINCSSLVGRISPPFFGTYTATKHALEGYSQALRYEVAPFGVDIAIVEPGPFGTGLLASGRPPALGDVLASYGALAGVPTAMGAQFAQMLSSDGAPDPQLVVNAYLSLAEMPEGAQRMAWFVEPIQTTDGAAVSVGVERGEGRWLATGQRPPRGCGFPVWPPRPSCATAGHVAGPTGGPAPGWTGAFCRGNSMG